MNRPALRYHGGKWRLAPWIIGHFPKHRVYVEPFGGAASVLLRKPRSYAEVYNDMDGDTVNVFRVLRDPESAARLAWLLRLTPFSRDEFKAAYESTDDPIERARRTIVRSMMGFGSASATLEADYSQDAFKPPTGFRSCSNRSGTTPAHDWTNYPPLIAGFCERLAGVVIESKDYAEVIAKHDSPETLIYADPPYVHSTRKVGNPYCKKGYRHEMQDADHERLAAALHRVNGYVILSGYRSELYDKLFNGWTLIDRGSYADGAKKRTETLYLSPRTVADTQARLLEVA
jgi:DNA adenine methylase